MKYMLMMHTPAGSGSSDYGIMNWPKKDIEAHIAFMIDLNKQLQAKGEFVGGEGLSPPSQAKRVKADKDGKPVTDGVFPESKEFLAGFWILDVANAQRAYEIAAQISKAPGIGGQPMYMTLEVREVPSGPPPV